MTTATQAEFARQIGVARSRINALKDAGRIVMAGDKVDVEASIARIEATRSPAHDAQAAGHRAAAAAPPAPPEAPPADDKVGNSYQAARAVKERYLALSAKRDYEQACGQLLRADEAIAATASAAVTLRTNLETLPDTLTAALAGTQDESTRRAVIADAIEHLLTTLAADFARIGRPVTAGGKGAA